MASVTVAGPAKEGAEQPYKRGYTVSPELRTLIAQGHQTRLGLTTLTAVIDCLLVAGACVASAWLFTTVALPYAILAFAVACALAGRQLRGLECLVHEASHFNWSRKHRKVNDILAFLLAGVPVGAKIADYRTSHLLHHGRFGTSVDPDLTRYRQLNLEGLRRDRFWTFVRDMVTRLPRYQLGWVSAVTANPVYPVITVAWAALFVLLPAWLLLGAAAAWIAFGSWLVCYVIVLPIVRFIGESSEHIYSTTETVFDATISNIGFWHWVLFHPHNDGYHTIHHMWPGIPHHQIRRIHQELTLLDADNYGKQLRYRTRVLQDPVVGI